MKRLSLLLLALCLLTVFLPSCARLDTTGLLEAAPDLIARSATLNEIYYGKGIPYDQGGTPIGNYYPADAAYLAEAGFHTIEELKALTATVFSADYCTAIFSSTVSGYAADGSGYIYSRYSSSQVENLRDENETILVSSTAENALSHILSVSYGADLRLGEVGRDYATLLLTVTTTFAPDDTHPAAYTESEEMPIRFVYENGWRIDSATY